MRNWNSKPSVAAILLAINACMPLHFASAATAAEEARMAQCPEGAYAGPREGARRFMQDPYVWFVSREFAKRFCMPEQFVDDSLSGALAVAVRLKPDEEVTCGMFMGRSDQCPVNNKLLIDVYVDNRKANIPKADPSVNYYAGKAWNSRWYLGTGIPRMKKRDRGEMMEVEGERRPFSPYTTNKITEKDWTRFLYLGVRSGWATRSGVFIEDYYRANWIDGVDLISLEISGGYGGSRNPDLQIQTDRRGGRGYRQEEFDQSNPIQKWAIGVLHGSDYLSDPQDEKKRDYPRGYLHVIELPHKVAQMIYAYDHKQGEQFFNDVKRAITQPPASAPAAAISPSSR